DLTYDKLINLEKVVSALDKKDKKIGFREKSVSNILSGIEKSKSVTFEKVLFALGIRYVGETVSKKLAFHYRNIDNLKSASLIELITVDEIGEKIAGSVINYFSNPVNLELIDKLKQSGLQFELQELSAVESNQLKGQSFVVSGVFSTYTRDGIKTAIESNGGKVSSSVSSKTDYLVAGENMGPEKRRKAEELGVSIITEQDLRVMISGISE
ncbi:MAG: NAD-dependent DNA ligase LigA, partial [Lentimicrobium sp.]|nr:NAD-dependent DNA ligase LigA [Lentimicrobium sp.]